MTNNPVKLEDNDWNILFNQREEFKIGNKTLVIRPLGLENFAFVVQSLTEIMTGLGGLKTTKNGDVSFNLLSSLPVIAKAVQQKVPSVLAMMSGLGEEDVKRLPPMVALDLLNVCVEVNIQSQEMLGKKLHTLAEGLTNLIRGAGTASEIPSKP